MKTITIGVIGNPNSGKSTVFNGLTGLNQRTGNWSGVTVEKKVGVISKKGCTIKLVDLPGLYSLGVGGKKSLDQNIALNFITKGDFDYLIDIVDSTKLDRNLYLILQLLERKIPVILVLNMTDSARKKGMVIDEGELSKILHCPVIKISAKNSKDIVKLGNFLALHKQKKQAYQAYNIFDLYPEGIKKHHANLEIFLKSKNYDLTCHEKMMLMEGDLSGYHDEIQKFAQAIYGDIEKEFGQTSDFALVNSRYNVINKLTKKVLETKKVVTKSFSDKLDNVFLNKLFALPIFLLIMYLMFIFSINLGGVFQDFFSLSAQATFVDIPMLTAHKVYDTTWLKIAIQGIGGGIQTVASFIPIIAAMYIFLSFLEGSGYIARAAVITNKLMKSLQLSGQSFFPLIVGLGCNVPAITGTRILSNHRERISTIMMSPFISCTARLAVYMLFCFIFFPNNVQNVIFFLYIVGIVMAIITGLLVKDKSTNISDSSIFIELPEYRLPKIKSIINNSILRTKFFIFGAGKIIIVVFFIIHIISAVKIPIRGVEGGISETTLINVIGQKITPIFEPLGLKEKNWSAVVGIFTGIFAKEVIVGTLVSLYVNNNEHDEGDTDIIKKYREAIMSIPKKLGEVFTANLEVFHIDEDDTKSRYYEANALNNTIIKNIRENFDDKLAVLAYLIFILIYFPCVSVFGVMSNEIGKKWATISAVWSTISAYTVSVIFYQTANMVVNGIVNYKFLLLGIVIFAISAYLLRLLSKKNHDEKYSY